MRRFNVKLIRKIKTIAKYIAASMVLTIFLTFCINVILRYTIQKSFGWIVESSLILWLWVIFLGAAIFLEEEDHVSFVYMYRAFGKRVSDFLKALSYVVILAGCAIAFLPTWDYISFLKIRESNVIGIPMSYVFVIYQIFLIALIIKYAYKLWRYIYGVFRVNYLKKMKRELGK